ncbi:hypothetical protein [Marinicauda sp. Alg238-R41]|nr:hypothetical protein [Marinicauda sp. Alg238-R41]
MSLYELASMGDRLRKKHGGDKEPMSEDEYGAVLERLKGLPGVRV